MHGTRILHILQIERSEHVKYMLPLGLVQLKSGSFATKTSLFCFVFWQVGNTDDSSYCSSLVVCGGCNKNFFLHDFFLADSAFAPISCHGCFSFSNYTNVFTSASHTYICTPIIFSAISIDFFVFGSGNGDRMPAPIAECCAYIMFNCNYRAWVCVCASDCICVCELFAQVTAAATQRRSSSNGQLQLSRCAFVVFAASVSVTTSTSAIAVVFSFSSFRFVIVVNVVGAIVLQLLFRMCCFVCVSTLELALLFLLLPFAFAIRHCSSSFTFQSCRCRVKGKWRCMHNYRYVRRRALSIGQTKKNQKRMHNQKVFNVNYKAINTQKV